MKPSEQLKFRTVLETATREPNLLSDKQNELTRIANTILAGLLLYALIGVLTGGLELFQEGGVRLISGVSWKVAAVLASLMFLTLSLCTKIKPNPLKGDARIFALGYGVLLLSDYFTRRESYYFSVTFARTIPLLGGAYVACFALLPSRSRFSRFPLGLLVVSQLAATISFLHIAQGRTIFNDDHPSFLYRLHLLRHAFPWIPFYNPDWNAGYSAREFFPSGTLNLYLLSLPFVHLLPDMGTLQGAKFYTLLIPYLLIGIIPVAIFLASRFSGQNRETSVVTAILSLSSTVLFSEFSLQYGTLPFVISSGLFSLSFVLLWRLSVGQSQSGKITLFATIVTFLCSTWHLLAIAYAPAALFLLAAVIRSRNWTALAHLMAVAVVVVLLNLLSITTLLREAKVGQLAASTTMPGSTTEHADSLAPTTVDSPLAESQHLLRRLAGKCNPLLLLFSVPAILGMRNKSLRWPIASTAIWLLLLASFGPRYKPQFELHRMVIPLCLLLCLPVAEYVVNLLHQWRMPMPQSTRSTICSIVCSMLITGGVLAVPVNAAAIYGNSSYFNFSFEPEYLPELVDSISKYGGEGRTFITGFILHELGAAHFDTQDGGHVAPLPAFSGKPMYASHYYHVYWSTVDPIPQTFRDRGPVGIEEFLDLVNITAVITFKREWVNYCLKNPAYKEVWKGGRFRLFTRTSLGTGYFLKGEGKVMPQQNGIRAIVRSNEAVIKFRYLPGLRIKNAADAEIFPVPAFREDAGAGRTEEVAFIGIRRKHGISTSPIDLEIAF